MTIGTWDSFLGTSIVSRLSLLTWAVHVERNSQGWAVTLSQPQAETHGDMVLGRPEAVTPAWALVPQLGLRWPVCAAAVVCLLGLVSWFLFFLFERAWAGRGERRREWERKKQTLCGAGSSTRDSIPGSQAPLLVFVFMVMSALLCAQYSSPHWNFQVWNTLCIYSQMTVLTSNVSSRASWGLFQGLLCSLFSVYFPDIPFFWIHRLEDFGYAGNEWFVFIPSEVSDFVTPSPVLESELLPLEIHCSMLTGLVTCSGATDPSGNLMKPLSRKMLMLSTFVQSFACSFRRFQKVLEFPVFRQEPGSLGLTCSLIADRRGLTVESVSRTTLPAVETSVLLT